MASEASRIDEPFSEAPLAEQMDDPTPAGGSSDGDGEGGERTAREKLKKTSIAGLSQYTQSGSSGATKDHPLSESITSDALPDPPTENGGPRGRPSKKRSFEDLQSDDQLGPTENGSLSQPDAKRSHHKRMRSRDVSDGNGVPEMAKNDGAGIASPVQEESDDDGPGGAGVLVDAETQSDENAQETGQEKILEDRNTANEPNAGVGAGTGLPSTSLQETQAAEPKVANPSTLGPPSGFSNVSVASPFGAAKSPSPQTQQPSAPENTSSSAFASSGLATFASSEKSPFGANAPATGGFGGSSGFGGTSAGFGRGTASGFGAAKPAGFGSTSGFGGASPFGQKPSGFGSQGAFGAGATPNPFGSTTSAFAGSNATQWGKAKPFGSKVENEEEAGDEGEGDAELEKEEDLKPDSRFHEQIGTFCSGCNTTVTNVIPTVETGEEEEDTIFNCRAKLFHFEEKQWKERGVGSLKINVRYEPIKTTPAGEDKNGDDSRDIEAGIEAMERRARVLMRTDGVHRVILNSPVFKEMNVGTKEGDEPTGRTMMLTGMEDGKPKGFQIRVRNPQRPLMLLLTCIDRQRRRPERFLPQDPGIESGIVTTLYDQYDFTAQQNSDSRRRNEYPIDTSIQARQALDSARNDTTRHAGLS